MFFWGICLVGIFASLSLIDSWFFFSNSQVWLYLDIYPDCLSWKFPYPEGFFFWVQFHNLWWWLWCLFTGFWIGFSGNYKRVFFFFFFGLGWICSSYWLEYSNSLNLSYIRVCLSVCTSLRFFMALWVRFWWVIDDSFLGFAIWSSRFCDIKLLLVNWKWMKLRAARIRCLLSWQRPMRW